MKTLNDILPLHDSTILIRVSGNKSGFAMKKIMRSGPLAGSSYDFDISKLTAKSLRVRGYKFLPQDSWPWDKGGVLIGSNPSLPE